METTTDKAIEASWFRPGRALDLPNL